MVTELLQDSLSKALALELDFPGGARKKEETIMDEAKVKMMVAADVAITSICDGNTEYLRWVEENVRGVTLVIADIGGQIRSNAVDVMPQAVLGSMLGMFVAAHLHGHTMWRYRGELGLLSQPPSPGTH
jgi:hypothetical protein